MVKTELKELNMENYHLIKTSNTWKVYECEDSFYKKYIKDTDCIVTGQKIEKLCSNKNSGLCTIDRIIYQKFDSFENFNGYIIQKVMGKSYRELSKEQLSLQELTHIFIDLYMKIKANEYRNGYVFTDIGTRDNIIWNEKQQQNTIIDIDSIQVPGFKATTISSSIDNTVFSSAELRRLHLIKDEKGKVDIGIVYKDKFYDKKNKIYKTKINDLSLLILFYLLATGKNFMHEEWKDCEHFLDGVSIDLLKTGLDDHDIFYRMVIETVDASCDNKDFFLDALYELKEKYQLESALPKNPLVKQRKFIKK